MKRMQLFEFEDFSWFPRQFRDGVTDFIVTFHRILGTPLLIAPLIERALRESGQKNVVDLCSGGGGPIPEIVDQLMQNNRFDGQVTLTDLYPNHEAAKVINESGHGRISYCTDPVNAADVPSHLRGLRTMIGSFHHMPLPIAKKILKDAFHQRQPLLVFELTDNVGPKYLWWAPMPIAFLQTIILMPFVRGFSLFRFFFTYVVPVFPALLAWDGVASNARTYSPSDLKMLTAELQDAGYSWEIGTISKFGYPAKFSCVLGLPKK